MEDVFDGVGELAGFEVADNIGHILGEGFWILEIKGVEEESDVLNLVADLLVQADVAAVHVSVEGFVEAEEGTSEGLEVPQRSRFFIKQLFELVIWRDQSRGRASESSWHEQHWEGK